jgi:hypothetical protein
MWYFVELVNELSGLVFYMAVKEAVYKQLITIANPSIIEIKEQ